MVHSIVGLVITLFARADHVWANYARVLVLSDGNSEGENVGTTQVCFAYLTWLYGLFVRTLIFLFCLYKQETSLLTKIVVECMFPLGWITAEKKPGKTGKQ